MKMADFLQDILIKVFTTCDPKTRAKCILVGKKWNSILNSRKMQHLSIKHENIIYSFEVSVPANDLYTVIINRKIFQLESTMVSILRLVNPKVLKINGT